MATQFIKNNANYETMDNWNGFNRIVEKDGFKSLNLKQINANYTELIELQEESTYTLWCEVKSMYLQQISTIKGLLFDCFFVKEDGSYEETIYDACSDFEVVSQERTLQPDKWQVIEIRIHTKSLDSAKDEYTRIMFRPKFEFNEDEENGIDIYIKNVSFEDTDRRYFGNNLLVDSSKCEDEIYKLDNVERTNYRYYGGYIFETTDIKGSVVFNVAKELFKRRILRNGDKVRYSMFVRTTSESIRYPNLSFYMKRYNVDTQEDTNMYFYRSEFVGQITNEWQKMSYDFTVTSQMIDDSGNNLLWGDTGFFFTGQLNDDGVIYYTCPMLEIIGDNDIVREEWIPHKQDEMYKDYIENLIMAYGTFDKTISVLMRKNGESAEKDISYYCTSYTDEESSSSGDTFGLGNVGSKTVSIGIRNYDDEGIEILPRDLTNYILYIEKYYENGYDDSGNITVREGKYKVYTNPEDFSSNMTVEFQDRMAELDIEYNTNLMFPTTIRQQLEEIANGSNMTVDYTEIDDDILDEEINFYDNTYTKRDYLSWIGEKTSCNVFLNDDTITFKKINKENIKEQYVDYVSQGMEFGNSYLLRTVVFDNGIEYYSNSDDLMGNDDSVFVLKKDGLINNLSVDTNIDVLLEEGKTYTFDFKSNINVVGNGSGKIYAKLIKGSDEILIDSFEKTFTCESYGNYRLNFYYNAENDGDIATFSNFHTVEGNIPFNTTNTFYINNENMYIVSQNDIDNIYENVYGIDLVGCDGLKLIVGNPLIKSIDLVKFRFIDEMESVKYNKVPFTVYVKNHKLIFNKAYTSSIECAIESTNEENTKTRANESTRIRKISVNVDHNEQTLEILAQQQDEFESKQSQFQLSLDNINLGLSQTNETIAEINKDIVTINGNIDNINGNLDSIGDTIDGINDDIVKIDGNIASINTEISGLQVSVSGNIESINSLEERTSSIELDIDSIGLNVSNLQKDVVTINGSIISINGQIEDVNGSIGNIISDVTGIESDIDDINIDINSLNGDITTIQANISDIDGNIISINGELTNVKTSIEKTNENVSQINVELGSIGLDVSNLKSTTVSIQGDISDINTEINGINSDISGINGNITSLDLELQTTKEQVSQIEVNLDSIDLSISDLEETTVTINGEVTTLSSRMDSAEIKLEPTNILLAVNQQIGNGGSIYSTKFEIDSSGVHISGNGLDISNNSGTKVFYADSNGNLTLNGTIQADGGSIAHWAIGTWAIFSQFVETYIDEADCGISRGCNDNLSYDKDGLAFWAGASWVSDLNRARPSNAKFRVYRDGSMYATSANITGNITGSTITGSTITSNSTINVTTDLKVGNNIYLNQNVNTTKKIIFASGNEIWNTYTNSINYISVRSNYRVSLTADNGSYVAVTGSNYSSGGGVEIYSANTKVNINGGIYFTTAIDTRVYASIYNGSSNLYLRADSGYTAIYSYGNAVYYNGQYIDSNWSHGKFNPGNTGVALGGSSANNRWYRLYAANASSTSSDRRLKENIEYFKDRKSLYDVNGNNDIEIFFNDLKPSSFTMIDDKYKRIKFGFVAQDVINSLEKIGLSAYDVDFVSHGRDENGNISENAMYSLCYEEFIALNTHMIQKTISIVDNHSNEINILKDKIVQYESELEMFKSENANLKSQLDILNDKLEAIMRGDYEHNEYSN